MFQAFQVNLILIFLNILLQITLYSIGTNPGPDTIAYCMAKSALDQFNRCLAVGKFISY